MTNTNLDNLFVCPECGYEYFDMESDRTQHRKYHEALLHWLSFESQNVVYSDEHSRIFKIDASSSPPIIHQAMRFVDIGRREHGYHFPLFEENDPRAMAFIKTIGDRPAGVIIIEDINKMVHWPAYPVDLNRKDEEPIFQNPIDLPYGLRFIWTAKAMRRQGIARELIAKALLNLDIPINQLAWHLPLADCGLLLARALEKDTLSVYWPLFRD